MKYRYREPHEMKDSGVEWLGVIPKEWKRKSLKYELEFSVGGTPSTSKSEYFGGDNIWVTISDIKEKFVSESKQKITEKGIKSSSMNLIPIGSLLYTFKLSVGQVAFTKVDLYTNEAIASFKPNKKYNLNFWYYALSNYLIEYANENIYGAKLMNQELIKNAKLLVPSKGEQQKIADFLDKKTTEFNSVIEKKEKLIEKLEEAKKSLISEVVTGKKQVISNKSYVIGEDGQEEEVIRYEVRNRAVHEMKDSGVEWLGMISEEWKVGKIKFWAKLQSGNSITSDTIKETGKFSVYGGNGFRGYTDSYTHNGKYILIGRQGALCGNINYAFNKFWASEHAIVVTLLKSQIDINWLGELLRSMNLNQYSMSAAQPGLAVAMIQNLDIPFANFDEQENIGKFIFNKKSEIDSIIFNIKTQIEKIKEAKQNLISEAVTGKIEIM